MPRVRSSGKRTLTKKKAKQKTKKNVSKNVRRKKFF